MNWKRAEPGRYTSGPYTVVRSALAARFWNAQGPGIETSHYRWKADAQAACQQAAETRITHMSQVPVEPVVGDMVTLPGHDNRHGQISSVLPPRGNHNELTRQPLYCIKFSRGKRLCLFRREFTVVVP